MNAHDAVSGSSESHTVPAAPGSENEDRSGRPPLRSVALVEDDAGLRGALQRLLLSLGCKVSSYSSAEAFLAAGDPGHFDRLVLDVHLPGMSGPALAANMTRAGFDIPTIFLSASPHAARLVLLETGRPGILLGKPTDADQLWSVLALAVPGPADCPDRSTPGGASIHPAPPCSAGIRDE